MFPLKDNIPSERWPAVNVWLILVNIVCFLYELHLGGGLDRFIYLNGFVPARFFTALPLPGSSGPLPLFTSMFLHGSFFHLAGNMWMLWIFGDNVEDAMGHGRYLFFYLLCGLVAAFAQGVAGAASKVPMIGASGAISGVLGAYFLLYPRARVLTLVPIFFFFTVIELPAFVFLGLWAIFQFLSGAMASAGRGGIAWWCHVGGFAAGFLMARFFARPRAVYMNRRRR